MILNAFNLQTSNSHWTMISVVVSVSKENGSGLMPLWLFLPLSSRAAGGESSLTQPAPYPWKQHQNKVQVKTFISLLAFQNTYLFDYLGSILLIYLSHGLLLGVPFLPGVPGFLPGDFLKVHVDCYFFFYVIKSNQN